MDIRQLNTFLTLSQLKNFTRTAEVLGYAQPSITAQVRQLENELGIRLFERIGKSVFLTQAGEALIPYATQILSASVNMKEAISPPDGRITVGAAESVCLYRLPTLIRAFKALYPEAEIYLKLVNDDAFVPMLCDNSIDVALTMGERIGNPSVVSALACPEEILILSAPGHPLASKSRVTPHDLAGEPFILTETGCGYRRAFERDMLSHQVRPRTALETGSLQAIKEMCMSGLGLCVLPRVAVSKEIGDGRLVPLSYETDYRICSQLIYHKDKWLSRFLDDFISLAGRVFPEQAPGPVGHREPK